jgi:hypothetical protein
LPQPGCQDLADGYSGEPKARCSDMPARTLHRQFHPQERHGEPAVDAGEGEAAGVLHLKEASVGIGNAREQGTDAVDPQRAGERIRGESRQDGMHEQVGFCRSRQRQEGEQQHCRQIGPA